MAFSEAQHKKLGISPADPQLSSRPCWGKQVCATLAELAPYDL